MNKLLSFDCDRSLLQDGFKWERLECIAQARVEFALELDPGIVWMEWIE